ncbi:MAG: (d)CMP kinase [Deltaproteobacteria bacterium]|nr:(d)CMP kinase [Deltaproteobacteria bacterium]
MQQLWRSPNSHVVHHRRLEGEGRDHRGGYRLRKYLFPRIHAFTGVPLRASRLVITIDGPSGAGKSTLARLLALRLGIPYLDTGALYRTVAAEVIRRRIDIEDDDQLESLCRNLDIRIQWIEDRLLVLSSGRDVSQEIRSERVGQMASCISAKAAVRRALLKLQRQIVAKNGAILEGRDTGTVVAPDAHVKFYLDARAEERGLRRFRELQEQGMDVQLESVIRSMYQRDRQDRERDLAPLRPAPDAVLIDTTDKSIADVMEEMIRHVRKRIHVEV